MPSINRKTKIIILILIFLFSNLFPGQPASAGEIDPGNKDIQSDYCEISFSIYAVSLDAYIFCLEDGLLFLEDADYSPLGQKTYENYANNTASYYIYDEDKLYRLTEKQTSIATSSLQNLAYTYDKVGNITKIIDSSNTNTSKTVDFLYDDLHRLTTASSTNAVSGSNYRETYSYNAIGNITNKSDIGNYLYQGTNYANPHAATSINGITYAYDYNGNLTSDSTWTHTWDYDNRLTQSANGTATTTYAYDQGGNRVKKVEGGETSYYINQYYEVDNGLKKRHILANGAPIATIEDEINTEGCMPPESGDWTISTSCQLKTSARAPGDVTINANAVLTIASSSILEIDLKNHKLLVRHNGGAKIKKGSTLRQTTAQTLPVTLRSNTIYHYPDHLMGTSIDTNDQGVVLEAIDYLPFGETRIDEKTGTHENERKFAGYIRDANSGLDYAQARYYNSNVGKWISQDALFRDIGIDRELFKQKYDKALIDILGNPQELNTPRTTGSGLNSMSGLNWRKNTIAGGKSTFGWDELLIDPQQQNSYSYTRNNPIVNIDPDGKKTVQLNFTTNVGIGGGAGNTWSAGFGTDGSYGISTSLHAGGLAGYDASIGVGAGYSNAGTWGDTEGKSLYVGAGGKYVVGGDININFSEGGAYDGADVGVGVGVPTPLYMSGGINRSTVVVKRNIKQDLKIVKNVATTAVNTTVKTVKEVSKKLISFFTNK